MKISLCTITSAALATTAAAVEYSVSSCADLMAAVDENALTSLVITSSPIECDDYLRFVVRNDMTLSATVPEVVLSNITLKNKNGLEVVFEPDIVFRDVHEVVSSANCFQRLFMTRISPYLPCDHRFMAGYPGFEIYNNSYSAIKQYALYNISNTL